MNDVYKLLLATKAEGESFSDVLRRKFREKGDIMELAGAWSSISDEDVEVMKKKIRAMSKRSTEANIRRFGHHK